MKKSNKWEQFIKLGKKYAPKGIWTHEAYKLEGLIPDPPKPPVIDPNDESNWTEEEKKEADEEIKKIGDQSINLYKIYKFKILTFNLI